MYLCPVYLFRSQEAILVELDAGAVEVTLTAPGLFGL